MYGLIIGAATAVLDGQVSNRFARVQRDLELVKQHAANVGSAAANKTAATVGSLARWRQTVLNNRRLLGGQDAITALQVNSSRASAAEQQGGLVASLRAAEDAGRASAQAAFAGVSGQAVAAVDLSSRVRESMMAEAAKRNGASRDFDYKMRLARVGAGMIQDLDSSAILDNMDVSGYVPRAVEEHSAVADAFSGFLTSWSRGYQSDFVRESPTQGITASPTNTGGSNGFGD